MVASLALSTPYRVPETAKRVSKEDELKPERNNRTHNTSAGAADGVSERHCSAVHVDAAEVQVEQSERCAEYTQQGRQRDAYLALMRATSANASLISW